LTDDAGVGGPAWSAPLEVFAIDRDASEGTVGGYARCGEEGDEKDGGELHCKARRKVAQREKLN
jgi:hypothetical protein